MTPVRRGLAALVVACMPLAATGGEPDLYVARVPVAGSGGGALDAAFARALGEVFVKVSGDRRAGAAGTREAASLVRQYQPQPGGFVRVQFDPPAVRARLDAAGLPVWVAARPALLVVLPGVAPGPAVPGTPVDVLEATAAARGIVLVRAVPAGFPGPAASDAELLARAAEAGAGAVLLGRPDPTLGAQSLRWTLVGPPGVRSEWTGDLPGGVHGAVDRLAARFAAAPGTVADVPVRVTGIAGFAAYLGLAAWLESQDGIEAATLAGIAPDGFRYRLRVRGGAEQLRAIASGPAARLQAVSDDGVEPVYRLVGLP